MIFGLYFYEELQNIPRTVLGWKYIVIYRFVCSPTIIAHDYILTREKVAPHI